MTGTVTVIGSANIDLVVEVDRRPGAGETIMGSDLQTHPGGKGANQAAAAARAGAPTRLVACVGDDPHGALQRTSLSDAGVDTGLVQISDRPTGTALILLTADGENSIVVSPGANADVSPAMVDGAVRSAGDDGVVVLSMEIPTAIVTYAAERAADAGIRVVLNAAPAHRLDEATLGRCDPLIVNEHEAQTVLGDGAAVDHDDDFDRLASALVARGARSVVVTLGAAGAAVAEEGGVYRVPAHRVDAIDTTGAGDAFVGAVACELARGASLHDAVTFATAMSAVAVQRMGAQSSYADRAEVEAFAAGGR